MEQFIWEALVDFSVPFTIVFFLAQIFFWAVKKLRD